MRKLIIASLTCLLAATAAAQTPVYLDPSKPIEQRVDDALARMTLREKINVLHAQSKFSSAGVPRLGIPDFWTDDGPHGVRPDVLWDEWEQAGQTNDSCVAFPALTCLAATWNPEMARLYGECLGEEARYRGKDMILGPGVNIYRTPLGGRNFEYMGEDPYLSSRIVVPYIQGLQSKGVAACVKHFCLNNDEQFRSQVNAIVSDRALNEIYLPAFKAAVTEGHTWGLMGGYNLFKNQHNCHNKYLLVDLLKGKWQYDGVVVSDWGGTHSTDEAVHNGLDMEFGTWTDGLKMGCTNAYSRYFLADAYYKGIENGTYSIDGLNEKVRRVLRLFFRTNMAESRPRGFLCSESHYDAARKIAGEGIVLLRNSHNVLPIDTNKAKKVLVVGENAVKMMTVGGGSSSLKVQHEVSPLDGLRSRLGNNIEVIYERGYVGDVTGAYNGVTTGQDLSDNRTAEQLRADAVEKAREADYVVMFGGLNKSDHQDCEGTDRKEYALPYRQAELIEALAEANSNFVYVNISGNAVEAPWAGHVPAIVQAWYLGSEAGNAIADVLTGRTNPSGKLPFTWYATLYDCGAHALDAFPGVWRDYTGTETADEDKIIDEEYKEDIYVGYRWIDYAKARQTFAFGHGLSYTTFGLSNASLSATQMESGEKLIATVTVTNTGDREGSEVVQMYIHDEKSSLPRPEKELKGFAKVSLLPGESKAVSIEIDASKLSYFDPSADEWKAESGKFTALIGTSSDNLPIKLKFELK